MPKSRLQFALLVVASVFAVGLLSVLFPSALPVFDRLIPALMLVLGYYFAHVK